MAIWESLVVLVTKWKGPMEFSRVGWIPSGGSLNENERPERVNGNGHPGTHTIPLAMLGKSHIAPA